MKLNRIGMGESTVGEWGKIGLQVEGCRFVVIRSSLQFLKRCRELCSVLCRHGSKRIQLAAQGLPMTE